MSWRWIGRIADVIQISTGLPTDLESLTRAALAAAVAAIMTWALHIFSSYDPAILFLIAVAGLAGLVWAGDKIAERLGWPRRIQAPLTGLAVARPEVLKRIRLLEYHAMHLAWARSIYADPTTDEATIDDGKTRLIQKYRDSLLNLTPDVFPQSIAERFRKMATYDVESKKPLVAGMSRQADRALLLAQIDHLLTAIRSVWKTYGGVNAGPPD